MNNIKNQIKKIMGNKNLVAVISILAIGLALIFGYTSKLNSDKSPVPVPIAVKDIQPRTKIDESMIEYVQVPKGLLVETAYQNSDDIIGQYTSVNALIPKGSLFYKASISNALESADSYIDQIPKDKEKRYTLFYLPVNMETSYSNSILPGRYIDIYVETTDEAQPAVGRFIANIKILAVKDSDGNNVFENSEEKRTPAQLIFAVPEEQHLLLRLATVFNEVDGVPDITIAPVPTGYTPKNPNKWVDSVIVNDDVRNIIEEYSVLLPESILEQIEKGTVKKPSTTDKKAEEKDKDKKTDADKPAPVAPAADEQ